MRSPPVQRWRALVSRGPFPGYFGPDDLATLDLAFGQALQRVSATTLFRVAGDQVGTVIAERITALAATGEKCVDRLVAHALRVFFPENDATESEIDAQIRRRAYEIWEWEGRPHGRAEAHWELATLDLAPLSPDPSPTRIAPDPDSSGAAFRV